MKINRINSTQLTKSEINKWLVDNQKYINRVVTLNLPQNKMKNKEDYVNDANLFILEKYKTFDKTRGIKFKTYVHKILIKYIRTQASKSDYTVSIPERYHQYIRAFKKYTELYRDKFNREPSEDEYLVQFPSLNEYAIRQLKDLSESRIYQSTRAADAEGLVYQLSTDDGDNFSSKNPELYIASNLDDEIKIKTFLLDMNRYGNSSIRRMYDYIRYILSTGDTNVKRYSEKFNKRYEIEVNSIQQICKRVKKQRSQRPTKYNYNYIKTHSINQIMDDIENLRRCY